MEPAQLDDAKSNGILSFPAGSDYPTTTTANDGFLRLRWDPRGVQAPSGTSAHQGFADLGTRTSEPLGNGAQDHISAVSTFWTQAALGLPSDFCFSAVSWPRRSSGTRELAWGHT